MPSACHAHALQKLSKQCPSAAQSCLALPLHGSARCTSEAGGGRSFKPAVTVYLAFGHDEELSGQHGARAMAKLLANRVRLHSSLCISSCQNNAELGAGADVILSVRHGALTIAKLLAGRLWPSTSLPVRHTSRLRVSREWEQGRSL